MSNSIETYEIIQSELEPKLSIIRHNKMFYNVTKLIKVLESLDNCSHLSFDIWAIDWKDDVTMCKEYTKLPQVYYKSNIPKRFAGTYVHKLLFDQYILWLETPCRMMISIALDNHDKTTKHTAICLTSQTKNIKVLDETTTHIKNSNMRELQLQVTVGEIHEYLQDIIKLSHKIIKLGIIMYALTWAPLGYTLLFDK